MQFQSTPEETVARCKGEAQPQFETLLYRSTLAIKRQLF